MNARMPALWLRVVVHLAVYGTAAIFIFPLVWMIITSLKTDQEAAALPSWGTLLPTTPQWVNYASAVEAAELGRFYANTVIVAVVTTVLAGFHNAIAGFAFAKLRFRGRQTMFALTLLSMMLPVQVSFIFAYVIAGRLGLVDNLQALIVPFLCSAFGIFYMRQAISAVPEALLEAGRLDGMSDTELFFNVVVPSVWSGIAALAVFTFVASWNNFFWPLIAIDSVRNKTLPLAVADLSAGLYVQSWPVQMAAATILTVPLMLVFFAAQRVFIRGLSLSGLKDE